LARTTGLAVAAPGAEDSANRQQAEIMELFGSEESSEEDILNKIQS